MTQLNMIDHLGYGIERMNRSQANRYPPLPDYDLSDEDVLALDRVQKDRLIPDAALRRLRRKGLVEGRKPHLRVATSAAEAIGTKAAYVEKRGRSEEYCMALVTDLIRQHGPLPEQRLMKPSIQPSPPTTPTSRDATRLATCSAK